MPAEEPKKKAQSIIDSLPGSSLLSKTAILSSAAGLSVYAISNEYYVMNEETVIAFCLLAVWGGMLKYGGPAYKEWAESQNEKIKNILNSARADHTEAVKTRIEDVKQMGGVVDITKGLFEVSKVRNEIRLDGPRTCADEVTCRKPPSSRLRLSSSSSRPLWPPRPRPYSTPGSATRARLSSDSRRSWPLPSSPRCRRSSRTPRSCSRSCSRAWLMLRVRQNPVHLDASDANVYLQRLSLPRPNKWHTLRV